MSPVPSSRSRGGLSGRAAALARTLAADILDGRRPVGETLPSEAELADGHAVGIAAARAAVRQLEALGLVARSRGGLARVVSGDIRATYMVTAAGTQAESLYAGGTQVVMDRQRRVAADAELAALLAVAEGTSWLHLTGLRMPTETSLGPLSWVDVWLARDGADLAGDSAFVLEDIAALTGAAVAATLEDIHAAMLTPAQARLLRARSGTAALHVLRRYCRVSGAVVAAVRDVHPAERVSVAIRARR